MFCLKPIWTFIDFWFTDWEFDGFKCADSEQHGPLVGLNIEKVVDVAPAAALDHLGPHFFDQGNGDDENDPRGRGPVGFEQAYGNY